MCDNIKKRMECPLTSKLRFRLISKYGDNILHACVHAHSRPLNNKLTTERTIGV
jgi:hypothetical protein